VMDDASGSCPQQAFEAVGLTIAAMIFTGFTLALFAGAGNKPDNGDGVLAVNAESREAIDLEAKLAVSWTGL
jgi:hypothetical protein